MKNIYHGLGKRKLKNLRANFKMTMVMDLIQTEPGEDQDTYPDGKGEAARKGEKKIEGGTVIVRKL